MNSKLSQYRIVSSHSAPKESGRMWVVAFILVWLVSLVLVAWWVQTQSRQTVLVASDAQPVAESSGDEVKQLRQRVIMLEQSDKISRAANLDLQNTLAQRETQIASLRSEVAFYTRLAGPTAERMGLTIFSSNFVEQETGGFNYRVMLTQTLDRDAISEGRMSFTVEGSNGGERQELGWQQLQTETGTAGQAFSFRYFQELNGHIVLPDGFNPQRVHVTLQIPGRAAVKRTFDWSTTTS